MNPKQLAQYNENKKHKNDMYCTKCNQIYKNTTMVKCGLCGQNLIPYTENIPRCPTCQSANIKQISTVKKAVHGAAFGVFSKTAHSQFQCCNCGYKW